MTMKLADVEAIAGAFDAAKVRFIVVGGLAVAMHGFNRTTYDLDLVIQLEAANIKAAFGALAALGYRPLVPITASQFADPAMRKSWVEGKGMQVLNFHSDQRRETNVDVFVTEPFAFDEEYSHARVEPLAPSLELRIARIDTLIAMKRKAGRKKDLIDIEELMAIQKAVRE